MVTRQHETPSFQICGMDEVPSIADDRHSALLSIVDPDVREIFRPGSVPADRHLVLRFLDLIEADETMTAPEQADVTAILKFGDRLLKEQVTGALIHCHMGVSRSTAALAILLAQSDPDGTDHVFPQVVALRPQAWPNSRMIGLADELLGLDGRLMQALRHLYRHQIIHRPDVVDIIRRYGRIAEVKWALFDGASPADWQAGRDTDFEKRI
jgi:predicted protein tyrosine phosphatase